MTTLALSLDEDLAEFIQEQAAAKGLASPEEYMRALLLEERDRREMDRLEDLMIEGQDSGDPIEITPEYWAEKKRRFSERNAKRGPR